MSSIQISRSLLGCTRSLLLVLRNSTRSSAPAVTEPIRVLPRAIGLKCTRHFSLEVQRRNVQGNDGGGRTPLFTTRSRFPATSRLSWPGLGTGTRRWPTIGTPEEAKSLALVLDAKGRKLMIEQLQSIEDQQQDTSVFLFNGLPFIGFGILDNGIMIVAGEYIDITIGAALGISTMAAAALGNLVSDVAGVGMTCHMQVTMVTLGTGTVSGVHRTAGYVELLVAKVGVTPIALTAAQTLSTGVRWTIALGRAIGISIGCIIGMLPLLFFNGKEDVRKSEGDEKSSETTVTTTPAAELTTTPAVRRASDTAASDTARQTK